jgi:hypothetical protein
MSMNHISSLIFPNFAIRETDIEGDEKCIHHLGDLDVDGTLTLKWILKEIRREVVG